MNYNFDINDLIRKRYNSRSQSRSKSNSRSRNNRLFNFEEEQEPSEQKFQKLETNSIKAEIDNLRKDLERYKEEKVKADAEAIEKLSETTNTLSNTSLNILHFKMLELLGEGGFGQVYKAVDTKTGNIVAIKKFFSRQSGTRKCVEQEIKAN